MGVLPFCALDKMPPLPPHKVRFIKFRDSRESEGANFKYFFRPSPNRSIAQQRPANAHCFHLIYAIEGEVLKGHSHPLHHGVPCHAL